MKGRTETRAGAKNVGCAKVFQQLVDFFSLFISYRSEERDGNDVVEEDYQMIGIRWQ